MISHIYQIEEARVLNPKASHMRDPGQNLHIIIGTNQPKRKRMIIYDAP